MSTSRRPARTLLAVIAVAMVLALAACGKSSNNSGSAAAATNDTKATPVDTIEAQIDQQLAVPATTYVGKVEGTDAYVAVVDRGGEVVAYTCDSHDIATWFDGTADGGTIKGSAASGATLTATRSGNRVSGSVYLADGATHSFTAARANYPAGLWEAYGNAADAQTRYRVGWVVLDDGTQRGAGTKPGATVAVGTVDTSTGVGDLGADGSAGAAGSTAPPAPDNGGTGGSHDLCANLQNSWKTNNAALSDPDSNAASIKTAKRVMATAQSVWNADCKGTYGAISGRNI